MIKKQRIKEVGMRKMRSIPQFKLEGQHAPPYEQSVEPDVHPLAS